MAATIKNQVKALYRSANALLADRSLPASVRQALADVPAALKGTWADLKAQADGETAEDGEIEDEPVAEAETLPDGVSYQALQAAIEKALLARYPSSGPWGTGPYPWIVDTWSDHIVLRLGDDYWRLPVTWEPGPPIKVMFGDAPVKVHEVVTYEPVTEVIKHEGDKWVLYSADGRKKLGEYDTEEQAQEREKQVQYFKRQKEARQDAFIATAAGLVALEEFGKPGNVETLIDTFDDWAGGSVAKCITALTGKEGIDDAAALCAWIKGEATGSTSWRGDKAEGAAPEPDGGEVLTESASGHVVALAETAAAANPRAPLSMDIVIIKPGFGNARDGHYYSPELLAKYSTAFVGAKMFESEHRPEDRRNDNWVSTITGTKVAEDGSLVGRVTVHDGDFAERARNLASLNQLPMMAASIYASGVAREGEVDGQKTKVVESIGRVHSVDWVVEAGAGGQALALAESSAGAPPADVVAEEPLVETTTAAPPPVARERVEAILAEAGLTEGFRLPLLAATYKDEAAVAEAATSMKAAMAGAGAGAPFGLGARTAGVPQPESTAADRERAALQRLGINRQQ